MRLKNKGVLIIGSGIAGLSTALRLAEKKIYSTVIAKRPSLETPSAWAQGGIAAVMADEDSIHQHFEDTLQASAGTINQAVAMKVILNGPRVISWLNDMGVPFDKTPDGKFALGREGGHTNRRIIHAKDATGRFVMEALYKKAKNNYYIELINSLVAYELVTESTSNVTQLTGAKFYDYKVMKSYSVKCAQIILATGGYAGLYGVATSPAKGSGLGLACEAGCHVENLEYLQFHPTAFYQDHGVLPLITEALRGEGAILRDIRGKAFMSEYHALAELAPRDIVSRAMFEVMHTQKSNYLYLDTTHLSKADLLKRFPTINSICQAGGIDLARKWIPVTPAAHYACGGIKIDENGRTNVRGIFAVGECSSSGLHGANRLASNSLLEALVFAVFVADQLEQDGVNELNHKQEELNNTLLPIEVMNQMIIRCQDLMWSEVGIIRTNKGLRSAIDQFIEMYSEVNSLKNSIGELVQLKRLSQRLLVCKEVAIAALKNPRNLGTHYNADNKVA
jgi:L-aspartate oxidase